MKILQVSSHYVPAYRFGGPLQVAHQLGRALVAQGHQVRVCTTNLKTRQEILDTPVDQPVDVEGVQVLYAPVILSRKWGFSPTMARRLKQEICAADVVLVHAHFQFANWFGARLSRLCPRPYIIFAHSSLRRAALRSSNYWLKQAYLRVLEWQNLKQARFIAFNAEEEMEDSLFGWRGLVIPNGIDPKSFDPLPPRGWSRKKHRELGGKTCFLFLGRLDIHQKAVDKIVEGFRRVASQHPQAHLILAGPSEGKDAETIRRLVERLQLTNRVTMPGLVTGQEKVALLQDCDVFLLPSHYEGLSIALLEAMCFGLPVILSRHAGLARQVKKKGCGLVVEPSAESISQGMLDMLTSRERAVMGRNAHNLILQGHIWSKIGERLSARLLEIV